MPSRGPRPARPAPGKAPSAFVGQGVPSPARPGGSEPLQRGDPQSAAVALRPTWGLRSGRRGPGGHGGGGEEARGRGRLPEASRGSRHRGGTHVTATGTASRRPGPAPSRRPPPPALPPPPTWPRSSRQPPHCHRPWNRRHSQQRPREREEIKKRGTLLWEWLLRYRKQPGRSVAPSWLLANCLTLCRSAILDEGWGSWQGGDAAAAMLSEGSLTRSWWCCRMRWFNF